MKCYANRVTTRLINTPPASPVTTTQVGAGYRVLPEQSDDGADTVQDFKFASTLVFSGGGEGSTAAIVIQGSIDGFSWIDLLLGTVRTEAGTYNEFLDSLVVPMLPWVRAKLVIGGVTPPSVVAGVDVVSTAPFYLTST